MRKNITIAGLGIIILILLLVIFFNPSNAVSKTYHYAIGVSASNSITCTYPQTLRVQYSDDHVMHQLPEPETDPIIMTYSDLGTDIVSVKYLDATRTISELQTVKVVDNDEKIVLLEGTGDTYMAIHTIFKKSGVSIYSKELSLIGTPVGSMSMGTCVDSY